MSDSTALGRIAFLGGFLPRLCGIATFTHDLCEAVAEAAPGSQYFAGAVNDPSHRRRRHRYDSQAENSQSRRKTVTTSDLFST